MIQIKPVSLTLCKTQVHAGEEQEKEKSLGLHGRVVWRAADRQTDEQINEQIKSSAPFSAL